MRLTKLKQVFVTDDLTQRATNALLSFKNCFFAGLLCIKMQNYTYLKQDFCNRFLHKKCGWVWFFLKFTIFVTQMLTFPKTQ